MKENKWNYFLYFIQLHIIKCTTVHFKIEMKLKKLIQLTKNKTYVVKTERAMTKSCARPNTKVAWIFTTTILQNDIFNAISFTACFPDW